MFGFLCNLLPARSITGRGKSAPARRRAQIGFEVLEGRALPSVTPLHAAVGPFLMAQHINPVAYVAPVVDVANLQGVSFYLLSTSGKPAHDLAIQSETYLPDGSATFTGTWTGHGANGGNPHQVLNGKLKFDANGNITISFAWTNGSGSQNTLFGTITKISNGPVAAEYLYGNHYHLEGDVTTPPGTGGGPGHVYGNGGIPFPLAKAAW